MSCEFWLRSRIVPVLMFESWVLNEIWIIDPVELSSALVGKLMSSSKLLLFLNEARLHTPIHPPSLLTSPNLNILFPGRERGGGGGVPCQKVEDVHHLAV